MTYLIDQTAATTMGEAHCGAEEPMQTTELKANMSERRQTGDGHNEAQTYLPG